LPDAASSADPIYVIDSSALIDLRRDYPRATFDRLWERFAELAAAGRLIAPEEVRLEIGRRDDDLKAWASAAEGLFRAPDQGFMSCLARVVDECDYLVPLGRRYAADSWVVALALQLHEAEAGKMFPTPCHVVSHEVKGPVSGRLHIPDACEHFGLSHIRLVRVFDIEGWSGH
jgi:hypothetical protein